MTLRREDVDHVSVLTIDRPEVRNALDSATTRALDDAFDELADDDEIWAVVLTGAGDQAFCAGQDLREVAARSGVADAPDLYRPRGGWGGLTRRDFPKPLIAAVNGAALGGGLELVLACDLVVADEEARFGLPEVLRGVFANAGGLVRIARRLPPSVAMELTLTGLPMSAQQAHDHGLVNRVAPRGEALAVALELAADVCAASPVAARLSKRVVRAAMAHGEAQLFALQDELREVLRASDDFSEGPRAFLEKRPPRWSGR